MSQQNIKKSTASQNATKTPRVPSTTPERPTSRQNAKSAPRAIVGGRLQERKRIAEIYACGGKVEEKIDAAKSALEELAVAMGPYRNLVSDKGKRLTDRGMGRRDMDIVSGTVELATTAVALLVSLLCERRARSLAVAANDLLVLNELSRAAWASYLLGAVSDIVCASTN